MMRLSAKHVCLLFPFSRFLLLLERVYTRTRASAVTNAVFLAAGYKTAQPEGAKSPQGDDASAEDIGRVQGSGLSGGQGQ